MPNDFDFADAEGQRDFGDLLPNGLLAFGVLRIRPYNPDQGVIETPSKSSEARFLDCEITIEGGPFDRRKVFTRIGTAGSEKYINMGRSAIKAILEVGRRAGPQNMDGYKLPAGINPATGQPAPDYMALDGLQCAIKVKVEKGKDGYEDKNDVAVWLSPIDPAVAKPWSKLLAGEVLPAGAASGAQQQPAWGQQQPQQQPPKAPPPAATERPGWLGNQQPQQPVDGQASTQGQPMQQQPQDGQGGDPRPEPPAHPGAWTAGGQQ